MAHVLLVNPFPWYARGINKATLTPPVGLAYLGAALEREGHTVQVIDANLLGVLPGDLARQVIARPDLIGISTTIVSYQGALAAARALRGAFVRVPIVFGGPFATSCSRMILSENDAVDAVVMGEGEQTLCALSSRLGQADPFDGVAGLLYRSGAELRQTAGRELIANLDDIPFPAYHLLPPLSAYKTRSRLKPVGYLFTSRGCPSPCTFCNRTIFGNHWRPHSVGRVLEDIGRLVTDYGIQQLDILDDNFTLNAERVFSILEGVGRLDRRIAINLQNGIRIDRTTEDILKAMKRAGVFKVGFGIESADEAVQKNIRKPVDLERAVALTRCARTLGIVTYGFFIIGLPGDTRESIMRTIRFARRMNPHFANFSICIPFPGSALYADIVERGRFLLPVEQGVSSGFFGTEVFYTLPGMVPEEIRRLHRLAYRSFYARPRKALDVLLTLRSYAEFRWLWDAATDILQRRAS